MSNVIKNCFYDQFLWESVQTSPEGTDCFDYQSIISDEMLYFSTVLLLFVIIILINYIVLRLLSRKMPFKINLCLLKRLTTALLIIIVLILLWILITEIAGSGQRFKINENNSTLASNDSQSMN